MILHVKEARYLRNYVIWVRFNDGAEGEVDLADELEGEVFGPLRKSAVFRALRVDPVLETVVWPNQADLAPEFLYQKMEVSTDESSESAREHKPLTVREGKTAYRTRKRTRKQTHASKRLRPK